MYRAFTTLRAWNFEFLDVSRLRWLRAVNATVAANSREPSGVSLAPFVVNSTSVGARTATMQEEP